MIRIFLITLFILIIPVSNYAQDICDNNTVFNIGRGIADITGPAAEEGMMGYGMLHQQTAGIYQRLWARAFIIESSCNKQSVIFVNADLGQIFQAVKQYVVKKLKLKYGDLYTDKNIILTATHTHSGPGGYAGDVFYNITTLGVSSENFNTIVDGIVRAIERAHANKTAATIHFAKGNIPEISFNRSPQAYLQNPPQERTQYNSDVDNEMLLIRFDSLNAHPLGLINWFPLHGVSMNNKNHLITGDNKGYAAYRFEKDFTHLQLQSNFISAFAQAHSGDVSPNPFGQEGGEGEQGLQAVEKAGLAQYVLAKKLFNAAKTPIVGGVKYRHEFIAFDDITINKKYTQGVSARTCPAAIGISMLAGTQDGEGLGKQGVTCNNISDVFSFIACQFLTTPCQGAKPIALETGSKKPFPWTPNILPLQLVQIGNLVIIAVPFELTTMSGRRLINTVEKIFPEKDGFHLTLSTLANAYAGYVSTREEYDLQRYEAASTHFGPWQLAALQQEFDKLAFALKNNLLLATGPNPPDIVKEQIDLQPGVIFDDKPLSVEFGHVHQQPRSHYDAGDTVEAVFWGGHPKNNFKTETSYLFIEHLDHNGWKKIRNDNDWDTEYHWQREGIAYSKIRIIWRTAKNIPPGIYRIVHQGHWKSGWNGKIYAYEGISQSFNIH